MHTLKEIIDEFDGQKQVVKAKLEQQHRQFKELEGHFEEVTGRLEAELRAEKALSEELAGEKAEALRSQKEALEEKMRAAEGGGEWEEKARKSGERVAELEEALRESVAITAEREFVFGQQKKRSEAIEEDVRVGAGGFCLRKANW